jgi:UDP-N-acetylglucosamine 4-epimerase
MDNLSNGFLENVKPFIANPKVEYFRGDIRVFRECQKAVRDIDYVCHQAAMGSVPRSIEDPLSTHDNNVNGFINMLYAAKEQGIQRFIYASSSSVYGDATDQPKVEKRIGKPLSPYAVSKFSNELYGEVFSKCYDMQIGGFRYFNVFGARQDPFGPYAAVIPLFIKSAITGKSPVINGDGSITRDYTYVKNVVKANINALDPGRVWTGHRVFNIACGKTTDLNQLWQLICELTDSKTQPTYGPNRKGDILQSLADISEAENTLDFCDLIQLREGLMETIPWYKNNIINK